MWDHRGRAGLTSTTPMLLGHEPEGLAFTRTEWKYAADASIPKAQTSSPDDPAQAGRRRLPDAHGVQQSSELRDAALRDCAIPSRAARHAVAMNARDVPIDGARS